MERFEVVVRMKSGDTHIFQTDDSDICDRVIDEMNLGRDFISIEGHLLINLDELESISNKPILVINSKS
ncbi:hypothetical protein NE398_20500 [Clostridium tertium]|uniref:Uncharacterized protein n=1 Tax=Clostridium tertium TaxID=1559 RepID=A0A9X3XQD5_9CLOT|nr:hypothetical protein [Clostridium tertium]MDC4242516.1 hypothetical protein [Clostridium tertium]